MDPKERQLVYDEFALGARWLDMEKTTLAFLPDKMRGRIDWGPLIPALESAFSEKDDGSDA
jgi:hypothetical protein